MLVESPQYVVMIKKEDHTRDVRRSEEAGVTALKLYNEIFDDTTKIVRQLPGFGDKIGRLVSTRRVIRRNRLVVAKGYCVKMKMHHLTSK